MEIQVKRGSTIDVCFHWWEICNLDDIILFWFGKKREVDTSSEVSLDGC
jgi:hypothetical protein